MSTVPPGHASRRAGEARLFPAVRAGHGRPAPVAVQSWLEVAWLMFAEGRAYVEDLEGGVDQPQMQQAAKMRLLETLSDIDNRLSGRIAASDPHCLALALEYGFGEVADVSGDDLIEIFALDEEFGGASCRVDAVLTFWQRLLDGFPGALPDRLVASGHADLLRTLRVWARLARAAGLDVGLLAPLIKDA